MEESGSELISKHHGSFGKFINASCKAIITITRPWALVASRSLLRSFSTDHMSIGATQPYLRLPSRRCCTPFLPRSGAHSQNICIEDSPENGCNSLSSVHLLFYVLSGSSAKHHVGHPMSTVFCSREPTSCVRQYPEQRLVLYLAKTWKSFHTVGLRPYHPTFSHCVSAPQSGTKVKKTNPYPRPGAG